LSASIFTTIEEAKAYILTGDATLTLEPRRSGTKFTYRVTRCKDREQPDLYFVSLLIGDSVDDGQFKYLGIINRNGFRITINSGVNADAPSAKAFESFFLSTTLGAELEVRHEGRCGRTHTASESWRSPFTLPAIGREGPKQLIAAWGSAFPDTSGSPRCSASQRPRPISVGRWESPSAIQYIPSGTETVIKLILIGARSRTSTAKNDRLR
jgi:hypothetical protein